VLLKNMPFTGVALAALLSSGIHFAQANTPTKMTIQDDFIMFDSCSGESVHFVGTTIVSTAVSIQNGIAHLSLHVIARDDGIGVTSGASYQGNGEQNFEQNAQLINGVFEANDVGHNNLIGQGAIANESLNETFHITVNPSGTITVLRTDINLSCHRA
jgi:hypothetical protein